MGRITFTEPALFRGEYRLKGLVMDGVSQAEAAPYTTGDKPYATWEEAKAEELKDLPLDRLQSTAQAQGIDIKGLNKADLLKKLKS